MTKCFQSAELFKSYQVQKKKPNMMIQVSAKVTHWLGTELERFA